MKIKVMTVLGTRPEIIRLSRVLPRLDQFTDHVLVHTGQNYDFELNEIFFNHLRLRKPDILLKTDCSSIGSTYGTILIEIEKAFASVQPDAMLILGDTNSSIAALIAKRKKIPIYHMEAGNRCFDPNVPEEINRKIIDHISDINLVYTEHARRNLLSEGLPARRIYLTGSPMAEVLKFYQDDISSSPIIEQESLETGAYFTVSVHREENVDDSKTLGEILALMNKIVSIYKLPIVVSTHPRTRKRIQELKESKSDSLIRFSKPFGFFDYVKLQKNSYCVISDSGTISEEASILNFPAISLRNAIERPEAMDTGTILLTGLNERSVISSIELARASGESGRRIPEEYRILNVSERVINLIVSTSLLSNKWSGVTSAGKK